jgi:uncharacterized coiled-coil DUF342 family protein
MLKGLQKELQRVNSQLSLAREFDAPLQDIENLKAEMATIAYKIMKICRGEN